MTDGKISQKTKANTEKIVEPQRSNLNNEISISNRRFKTLFKLKNQIPIPNLRKCLAQINLRQKNPIYNPRIKIQFPIQEYVCLKSLGIYDLAKFLGESAKKIYINKHLIKNYVRKL